MAVEENQVNPPKQVSPPQEEKTLQGINLIRIGQYVVFFVIGLAFIGLIIWGISSRKGFLDSLEDIKVARGLITFLIAIATVGIALILTLSAITSDGDGQQERFERGRQILAVFVGILGTIVGFYFGSSPEAQAKSIQVSPAVITNEQPKKGEKTTIISYITGGDSPYVYSISFDPAVIPEIKNATAKDGVIREEITIPPTIDADKEVKFQIDVRDDQGKTITYKDDSKKLRLKVQ
jgi:hypothetical protein